VRLKRIAAHGHPRLAGVILFGEDNNKLWRSCARRPAERMLGILY
jgi:hypothetical protein